MKKSYFIYFILFVLGNNMNAFAADGVCYKCDEIREYNRTHPSKYVYYEDYLKDKEDGKIDEEDNNDKNLYVPPQKQPKKAPQPTSLRQTPPKQQR